MTGIGPGVVALLRESGIHTLGDVTRARLARVRGVGPWRTRQLLAWVAQRRG
jgi:DNA-binding helix-hairpin-helix protein with protein kinase domain